MATKWIIKIGHIAIVALIFTASAASASVIYSFSGTITTSHASGSAPTDAVLKGDAFSGRLNYTPERLLSPQQVEGSAVPHLTALKYSFIMQATFSNGIASWGGEFGAYTSTVWAHNYKGDSGLGGSNIQSGGLIAPDVSPSVHHDDGAGIFTLPDVIQWPAPDITYDSGLYKLPSELALNHFNGGEFKWNFYFPNLYGDEGHLFLEGTIDRLVKVSVPEPNPLALLALGLILVSLPKTQRT